MASLAYGDYVVRIRESQLLVREALAEAEPFRAGAFCKGAVVLAAAALERYVNDVVKEACRLTKVARWHDLAEGQQRYMARQIAKHLHPSVRRVYVEDDLSEAARSKLQKAVAQGMQALISPATWTHDQDYGLFMEGAAEAAKIDQTLRMFDDQDRSLFDFIAGRGGDRGSLARAVEALVEARHKAAHALTGPFPSPSDARAWILLSLVLTRTIEVFLGFRA